MEFFIIVVIVLLMAFVIALFDKDITEEEKKMIDEMHEKDLF